MSHHAAKLLDPLCSIDHLSQPGRIQNRGVLLDRTEGEESAKGARGVVSRMIWDIHPSWRGQFHSIQFFQFLFI